MGIFKGRILNLSDAMLWVVADGVAHNLAPNWASPSDVDADGVRTLSGAPIYAGFWAHTSWWKICSIENAIVSRNIFGNLSIVFHYFPASRAVDDNEFGPLTYDKSSGWGAPIKQW